MFDEEEKETYYLIESFVCLNACNETRGKERRCFSFSRIVIIVTRFMQIYQRKTNDDIYPGRFK
jgi:hypothetical protein